MSYDAIIARSPFIIYQPGGTASGVTVTTWSAVQKFIAARSGSVTVYIDDTFTSPAPVPAGTTNCEGRVIFAGATEKINPQPVMSLADGAVLVNPSMFTGFLHVICQGTSQPNMQFATGSAIIVMNGAMIENQGSQPVVRLVATQVNIFLFATGGSFNANPGALADMPTAPADVGMLAIANGGFQNSNNVITGVAGTNSSLNTDASINDSFIPSNPGFAGTFVVNLIDVAQLVAYLPAVPANWPTPPTQVAQALDELAAEFAAGVTLAGDVTGPSSANEVVAWRNHPLDPTTFNAPADTMIPVYDSFTGVWIARVLGGDVTMPLDNGIITVQGWESLPLDPTTMGAPGSGDIPSFNGTHWVAVVPSSVVALGGDVTGPAATNTVVKWEGVPLDGTSMGAPAVGDVPVFNVDGTWHAAPVPPPAPPNVPALLSQTRFQYWSGVPATTGSGISFGSNCLLVIGSSNLGVYQSATNLLQSCSRGTAETGSAGPAWLGSYDYSAATGSYKNSFVLRGAAPGIGGFTHTTRFGIEEISATPTLQCFVGLMDASGGGGGLPQSGSIDWTTQTTLQVVGIAFTEVVSGGALTGNWKIVSCNGAAVTSTDSGVPLVAGNLVELILVALPDAATIAWTINDLTAATTTSGTISTTLPANTLALAWQAGMNVETGGGLTNVFSTVRYTMDSNY